MAENKKAVIIYADWIKKFEALTDDEAGKLIKHFFRYVNDQNPKAVDRMTELLFIDIEQSLKRDLKKWEERAERSRENGLKGGRPPKEENLEKPEETQRVILKPRKPDSVNDSVSVIVKDTVKDKKGKESASPFDLVFSDFLLMRKTIRKPCSSRAQELIKNKLEDFAPKDVITQIKILEQSIENSWQTVYPLKNNQQNGTEKNKLSLGGNTATGRDEYIPL